MTMKRLLLATSILALTAGGALAQSGMGTPSSPAVNPGPTSPDTGTTPNDAGSGTAPSNMGGSDSGMSGTGSAATRSDPSRMGSGAMNSSSSSAGAGRSTASAASGQDVIRAQQALKDKGLYQGQIDGKIGPQTRTAISQFQRQNGLKQSAQLDRQTMSDLEGSAGSSTAPGNMPSSRMPSGGASSGGSMDRSSP